MERANEIGLGCRLKDKFLPWTNCCHSSIHAWIYIFCAAGNSVHIYQNSRKFLFYKVTDDNEVSEDQILAICSLIAQNGVLVVAGGFSIADV